MVVGRRPLGESDRLVEFYARDFGKIRGVAKSARRPRSRFGSALEPFTLGELVFFDTGRSELVRVDAFDILRPFAGVREDLERLGRAAWMVECVARLSADRDPHPALFQLVARALGALEEARRPAWIATCFAVRAVDLLGHRPRLDRCVVCGRIFPFAPAVLDVSAGGLVCARCGADAGALDVSGPAVGTLRRMRALKWSEAIGLPLAPALEHAVAALAEGLMTTLVGQVPRSSRFLAQIKRPLSRVAEPAPGGRRR